MICCISCRLFDRGWCLRQNHAVRSYDYCIHHTGNGAEARAQMIAHIAIIESRQEAERDN